MVDNTILPDKKAEIVSDLKQIEKALQQLPDIDRIILIMRAEEEMSYRDIAQITGLSISAIKVKVYRARVKLDKILNNGE